MSDIEGCKPRVYDHNEALVFWARIGVFKAIIDGLSLKTADLAKTGARCGERMLNYQCQ